MPHSSGGGSHSSGSHSSHSSSSHGSSSGSVRSYTPPQVVSSKPRVGFARYAFYEDHHIRYQYIREDAKDTGDEWHFGMVMTVLFVLLAVLCVVFAFEKKEKLSTDYDTGIVIDDRGDFLSDHEEAELYLVLDRFLEKTGITPAFITDYNESWQPYYSGLENYAYDLYVNSFSDEKHWLIIYTQPEDPDPAFLDWYWEGMQGDDSDPILTDSETSLFNEAFQKDLTLDSCTVGSAAIHAIGDLTNRIRIGETVVDYEMIFLSVFFLFLAFAFGGIDLVTVLVHKKQLLKRIRIAKEKGIYAEEGIKEDKCNYCGGIYLHGKHESCPHCGAPIKLYNARRND